jgi:hypothetical protein
MKTSGVSWTGLDLDKVDSLVNPRLGVTEDCYKIYDQVDLGEVNLEGKTYHASANMNSAGDSRIVLDPGDGKKFEIHITNPASATEPTFINPICHIGDTHRIVSLQENEVIKSAMSVLCEMPSKALGFYDTGYLAEEATRICNEAVTQFALKNSAEWKDHDVFHSKPKALPLTIDLGNLDL